MLIVAPVEALIAGAAVVFSLGLVFGAWWASRPRPDDDDEGPHTTGWMTELTLLEVDK